MEKIECTIHGYEVNFDQAREISRVIADEGNDFATLVSWCDRDKGVHSPCCLKCELKGEPGWEVYGRNHEGRLRISFDDERFVFIYS
ncbi:MAG: AF1514 family protein [Desulfocapsa sp.]|nr:AF1514 family protein [Desulfocapsa sp.]